MKLCILLLAVMVCACMSLNAQTQFSLPQAYNADSVQKMHSDSVQRKWMKDSLGLSDQTITQVFALRDTCVNKTERISTDPSFSQAEKSDLLRALRTDTNNAIRVLMGEMIFQRYTEMIVGRRTSF